MIGFVRGWTVLPAAILVLFSVSPAATSAGAPAPLTARYHVSSRGHSVGSVTATQRIVNEGAMPTTRFETSTAIDATFMGMGYRLSCVEKGVLMNGKLIRYARKGKENGIPMAIEGRLENRIFTFEIRDRGMTRTVTIPRSSYDYTTIDSPEASIDLPENGGVSLRILDLEKLAVVTREYRLVRNGHYTVGGKEHPCRVVEFSDRNRKGRRWIASDGGTIVMYRQDTSVGGVDFSIEATSVKRQL